MTTLQTPQTAPTTSDPPEPALRDFFLDNRETLELIRSFRSYIPPDISVSSPETSPSSSTEITTTTTITIMEEKTAVEEVTATGETVAVEEIAAAAEAAGAEAIAIMEGETVAAAETATSEEATATKEAATAVEEINKIEEIAIAEETTTAAAASRPSQPPSAGPPTTTPAPTAELLSDPDIISPLESAKSKGECEYKRKQIAEEGEKEGSDNKPGELSVNPKMKWGPGPAPWEKNSFGAPQQARSKRGFWRRVFRRREGGGESGVVGNME